MIPPYYIQTMSAYNAEMNRRIYAGADALGEAGRRADVGLFWASVHATLAHVFWGDSIWLSRFGLGQAPDVAMRDSGAFVADWGDLRAQRTALDAAMMDWAARFRAEDSSGDLTWWSGAVGRQMVKPRAICLMQIFNHQTHHRGQVHAALTQAGVALGDTDLPFVLPE